MTAERRTVVAEFDSPEQARNALRKAGLSGIDGERMSVDRPPDAVHPRRHGVDRRLTRWVARRVVLTGVAGAVIGAVIALILASVFVSNSSTRWEAVGLTALAGFIVAFLVAGMSAFPMTPALTDTFEEGQRSVRLVVHAADADEAKVAVEALQAAGATRVNREE